MRISSILGASCLVATLSVSAASADGTDKALQSLVGKSVTVAVTYLGMPSRQTLLMEKKAYLWTANELMTESAVASANTAGMAQGGSSEANCTLYLFTTATDVVTHYDYDDHNGACTRFSNRLTALIKQ